jgi:cytochrome c oxidase subunit II
LVPGRETSFAGGGGMGRSLLMAADSGSAGNLSIFDPASPQAESIRSLSVLVLIITAIIFLIVEGILIYSAVRFRRRAAAGREPAQVYGSMPIEIAWTAAPALVVFMLVLVTTRTLYEVNAPPPEPTADDHTLFVTVVGRQWWWEFRYDHYNGKPLGFITANELHVPASTEDKDPTKSTNRPVHLTLQSADVIHSFWVPRLMGKTDLIPGKTNYLSFHTTKPGLYLGQCAEYCGTQHANMLLRVVIDPPDVFERWLANEKKDAPDDPSAQSGKAIFLGGVGNTSPERQRRDMLGDGRPRPGLSCVNCHAVRGTSARGTYGPDLTHLMSRQTLAAGVIPNDEEKLRDWVHDPQKIKPGCLMPAFGLSETDLKDVVQYLRTLK